MTRDFWQAVLRPDVSGVAVDVRLFHDSRCRLVHKYRVFRGTFPHPALRGKVMNKLTDLHISIPASGSVTEAVPESCFLHVPLTPSLVSSRRVSFARQVTVIEDATEYAAVREQTLRSSPALSEPAPMDIQLHKPVCTLSPEEDSMDASTVVVKPDFLLLPVPPPGFEKLGL